jgi:hypothetical protein
MVFGDSHCGHKVGFTPPDFDKRPGSGYGDAEIGMYNHRRYIFNHFKPIINDLSPDIAILNGDLIDGRGPKSGGTELITVDRSEQCDMATAAIRDCFPNNPEFVVSYGTPYHSGEIEDFEKQVAEGINARKIGAEDEINIYGVVINYRHHAGGSSIPHGRGTPLAKERLWNVMWSLRKEYPKADVLFRSHVHYFQRIGDADYLAVSCPALQGYGSKFGARRMSGTVDVGVCWLDVTPSREIKLGWNIKRFTHKNKFALVVS